MKTLETNLLWRLATWTVTAYGFAITAALGLGIEPSQLG
jgi:hypothetical protein